MVQLHQLYGVNHSHPYIVMDCQQQTNLSDCGLFAIANAVELVLGDVENVASARYDTSKMREHLKECLMLGQMRPFPRQSSIRQTIHQNNPITYSISDDEKEEESKVPPCYTAPFSDGSQLGEVSTCRQLDIRHVEKFCQSFKDKFLKNDSLGMSHDILSPKQIFAAISSKSDITLKKQTVCLHYLPTMDHYVVTQSSPDGHWIHLYDSEPNEMHLRETVAELEEQLKS